MNFVIRPWSRVFRISSAIAIAAALIIPAAGQNPHRQGVPEDWSHQHLIFSNPGTIVDALKNGKLNEWNAIQKDPRFILQQTKRNAVQNVASPTNGSKTQPPPAVTRDWNVPLGSGTVAANMFPAKYSFDLTTALCTDFAVFAISVAPSATQANLVAFKNLYSGSGGSCGTANPTVAWSYRIGTGALSTSPVLSLNGMQVAFIEHSSPPKFHVLTIGTTGTDNGVSVFVPATPGTNNNASDAAIAYSAASTNTHSSPFVNYDTDTAFVAADDGKLYTFHPVFSGPPALVGNPLVMINASPEVLTSPVVDLSTSKVFIGGNSGKLYSVGTAGGAVSSVVVGNGTLNGTVADPPIVDSSIGKLFATSGCGTTTVTLNGISTTTSASVLFESPEDLSSPIRVGVGQSTNGTGSCPSTPKLHAPAPDDNYYTNATSGNWHMVVCGVEIVVNNAAAPKTGRPTGCFLVTQLRYELSTLQAGWPKSAEAP